MKEGQFSLIFSTFYLKKIVVASFLRGSEKKTHINSLCCDMPCPVGGLSESVEIKYNKAYGSRKAFSPLYYCHRLHCLCAFFVLILKIKQKQSITFIISSKLGSEGHISIRVVKILTSTVGFPNFG